MKEITAYKCDHCNKTYTYKNSCRSHEYRCYHNPRTKSCISCAFMDRIPLHKKNYVTDYTACFMNHEIFKKLKTKCEDYILDDPEIKRIARVEIFKEKEEETKARKIYSSPDMPF